MRCWPGAGPLPSSRSAKQPPPACGGGRPCAGREGWSPRLRDQEQRSAVGLCLYATASSDQWALWCTFMFTSKRCKLVKRLWEERARLVGCDEYEAVCALEECAHRKAVEATLKRMREPQLELMLLAVRSRGRSGRACVPLAVADASEAPHVLCCRLWRWPQLRHHWELRRMPWCGASPLSICCNPYHWSIVQRPESPPPPYSRFPQESYTQQDRAPSEPPPGSTTIDSDSTWAHQKRGNNEGDEVEQLDQLRKATGAKEMKVLKTEKSRFVSVNGNMQGTSTKEETVKDAKSGATLANVKQSSQLEQRGPGERPRSVSKTQVDVPALGIHESKVEDSNALRPGETGHASQKKNFNYPWVNEEPDRGDYTPTDLAEYILRTGDEEGVALAVEELLRQGMMTREEAIVYLQDVKAEMNYIRAQQEKLRRIQELREAINMKKKDESVFKHRMNDVLGAKETVLPPNSHISAKAASANQQSLKPQKATQNKLHTAAERPSSTAAPSLKNTAPSSRVGQGDAGKARDNKVTSSGKLTPVDLDRMTEERVPPRSQPEADVVSILKKLKGATSLYDEYTLEEIIYWLAKDMFAHSIIKGDQSAEEALARFANFVESEVAQNKLSGEVEKKVLDIMLAALVDILRELPNSQYSGPGNQVPQRLFPENSERRPAQMSNSRPRSPSIRPREDKKKTVPVEKHEELVPASQKS